MRSDAFLTDPAGFPLLSALRWFEGVLLGPVATAIAVLAVASVGALMLTGRIEVRRGGAVVLGCFILFGATAMAQALRDLAGMGGPAPVSSSALPAFVHEDVIPAPSPPVAAVTDPYAGASLPTRR